MDKFTRALEITVISCEDLRLNGRRLKRDSAVTVRTDSGCSRTTKIDREGGSYPEWNETLAIDMPANARFFTAEVSAGGVIVGAARIPVSDFSGGYVPENYLHFLSYRLRDSKGERNGIINLSVRVKSSGKGGYANSFSAAWSDAMKVKSSGNGGYAGSCSATWSGAVRVKSSGNGGYANSCSATWSGAARVTSSGNGGYAGSCSAMWSGVPVGQKVPGGIVTGVPAWYGY